MRYRNPKLHNAVRDFAITALDILATRSSGLPHAGSGESVCLSLHFVPGIREIPSYMKCMRELWNDDVIAAHFNSLVGTLSRRSRIPGPEWLMLRLPELATARGSLVFDERLYQRRYREFEDSFYEPTIRYEVLAPLNGVEFHSPFSLSDGLEICRLTPDLQVANEFPTANRVSDLSTAWAVRTHYDMEKVVERDGDDRSPQIESVDAIRQNANDVVDRVLECLRLAGLGNVCTSFTVHRSLSWVVPGNYSFGSRYIPPRQFQSNLEPSFQDWIKGLWSDITSPVVARHTSLRLAVNRLSAASERHRWDDKVVDILIAGEAVFLAGSHRGVLKAETIGKRSAALLATNDTQRNQIIEDMRYAYKLRSAIVHGSGAEKVIAKIQQREPIGFGEKYKLDEFIYRIREHVRYALLKAVKSAAENPDAETPIDWAVYGG